MSMSLMAPLVLLAAQSLLLDHRLTFAFDILGLSRLVLDLSMLYNSGNMCYPTWHLWSG